MWGSGTLAATLKDRKPLIPSGPGAADPSASGALGSAPGAGKKAPRLKKRELERYRKILLQKRGELIGDVSAIEEGALKSERGSSSHLPQHMAEQGSDAYDQSLSLDLAAVDRELIREIDEAMKRIDDRTYGLCEITGKPINPERLSELPWTRYSIEAARMLERRSKGL